MCEYENEAIDAENNCVWTLGAFVDGELHTIEESNDFAEEEEEVVMVAALPCWLLWKFQFIEW